MSSPEVTHANLAGLTERIRLRPMSVNMIPFNHPIRIAEQAATVDVLSKGRAELGGARSNNPWTLDAFGVDAKVTAAHRDETLQIVGKALSGGEFEHHTELYDIPPPADRSATGPGVAAHPHLGDGGRIPHAGRQRRNRGHDRQQHSGVGVRPELHRRLQGRDRRRRPGRTRGDQPSRFFSTGVNCAADRDAAREMAAPVALRFVEVVVGIYKTLSERSQDYSYLGQIRGIEEHAEDMDYLVAAAPYITVGNPDDLIERASRLHEMGADDVLWRIDGMGHENNMNAIRMIGEHVIPALREFPEHEGSTT